MQTHADALMPPIADQPLALRQVVVGGDALVFVDVHPAVELDRDLVERQEPPRLRRHRHPRLGMGVHDATRILTLPVDGGMDHEARRVDRERGLLRGLALRVHQHQRGGGDLLEQQAVGIDQEPVSLARDPDREMG